MQKITSHSSVLASRAPCLNGKMVLFWKKEDISTTFSNKLDFESYVYTAYQLLATSQAASQFAELQVMLDDRYMDTDVTDIWTYSWGSSFQSKKAYRQMTGTVGASPLFAWLWSSSNLGKHEFFFWLHLRDRLNTRNIFRRKNGTWKTILVCFAILAAKKPSCTFSSHARSVKTARTH